MSVTEHYASLFCSSTWYFGF